MELNSRRKGQFPKHVKQSDHKLWGHFHLATILPILETRNRLINKWQKLQPLGLD